MDLLWGIVQVVITPYDMGDSHIHIIHHHNKIVCWCPVRAHDDEVIKLIVRKGKPLVGRLLVFDGMNLKFREVKLRKDPACAACGDKPSITKELIDYEAFCGIRAPAQPPAAGIPEIAPGELQRLIDERRPLILIDVREPREYQAGHIPGAQPIPLGQLLHRLHEFTWADEIVVYGGADSRSAEAAEILRIANFRKTRILRGGFPTWRKQGA
jgi:rhodanese-related sulfurtransferase